MNISFIYNNDRHLPQHESVIYNLCKCVSKVINLPDKIEVVFEDLGHSIHGDTKLDYRFLNRITINSNLFVKDIPVVLVHELIHVHQSHIGILKTDSHGTIYWNNHPYKYINELSYEEYMKLPWEVDVVKKHQFVLDTALNIALNS